jgi:hypothetical protein
VTGAIGVATAAAAALREPVQRATIVDRTPIAYDAFLPGRSVERLAGSAISADGREVTWSAVVKRTAGVDLQAARRELAAYRTGVASPAVPDGLRAPVLLAFDDGADHVDIWLEALTDEHGGVWPVSRYGIAAGHIATWDARMAATDLPADFDSEDAWAERHGQPHRLDEARAELDRFLRTAAAAELEAGLDDPGFARVRRLIDSTPARIERLATFQQTPLHHDLVRSNLFALADGGTAAIDWENVGRGPFGVDLIPLVLGSVRRGEASVDDLTVIEPLVLASYIAALGDAGIDREDEVRRAYRLAVGLRWHVVLGTIRAGVDPEHWGMRGSRRSEPRAEALRHLVALSRHILDVGASLEP